MTASWRDGARDIVQSLLLEYEAQCLLLGEPLNKKDFTKLLRDRYPWGARAHHPYQSWLKEQRLVLQYFDLMATSNRSSRHFTAWSLQQLGKPKQAQGVDASPGQMSLLG